MWAASIAWNQKFTGNFAPYGNDQHRVPDLEPVPHRSPTAASSQIGRSGVKHAWLTTNGGCLDADDHDDHILGRGCTDTYGTSNNDTSSDLGPRSEIVAGDRHLGSLRFDLRPQLRRLAERPAATAQYDQRLVVREPQISATVNPGSTYLFESWYIARDDINPYNSMATVTGAPNWSGSVWSPGGGSSYKLGPGDRPLGRSGQPAGERAQQRAGRTEGHAKLAVKVTDLGSGLWRYDYAVMNLDFARAVTSGSAPNVRVVSNKGFDRFSVPLPAGALVSATRFSDGDLDAGNDWAVSTSRRQGDLDRTERQHPGLGHAVLVLDDRRQGAGGHQRRSARCPGRSPSAYPLLTLAPSTPGTPLPSAAWPRQHQPQRHRQRQRRQRATHRFQRRRAGQLAALPDRQDGGRMRQRTEHPLARREPRHRQRGRRRQRKP